MPRRSVALRTEPAQRVRTQVCRRGLDLVLHRDRVDAAPRFGFEHDGIDLVYGVHFQNEHLQIHAREFTGDEYSSVVLLLVAFRSASFLLLS